VREASRERVAALERAIARALELLDAGRGAEARRLLARAAAAGALEPAPRAAVGGGIDEAELERAFAAAEPERAQMWDADGVAEAALRQVGEGDAPDWPAAEPQAAELPAGFATATMAELLERQGDAAGASRIRAGLAPARPAQQRVIATLERWLENVRRVRA
jgi:hypothetical protein